MSNDTEVKSPISRVLFVWLLFLAGSVVWYPLKLGFYYDDWPGVVEPAVKHGSAFSLTRLFWAFDLDPTRPTAVPIRYFLSSLLGGGPVAWQAAMLVAGAGTAVLLSLVMFAIIGDPSRPQKTAIWFAASCWLVFPWCVGSRFWPAVLPVYCLLLAFCYVAYVLIRNWDANKSSVVLPALLYLFVCVGYELFYLQFVPIIMIGLVLVAFDRASLRNVLMGGAGLVLAQAGAVLWYFVRARFILGDNIFHYQTRSLPKAWIKLTLANERNVIPQMLFSMSEVQWPFVACVVAALALSGAALVRTARLRPGRIEHAFHLSLVFCCVVGAVLSIVVSSMSGRGLYGLGVETRMFLTFSFWLVLAMGIYGAFVFQHVDGVTRRVFATLSLGLGFCLIAGTFLRAKDWAGAWRVQQKILANIPAEMASVPAGDHHCVCQQTRPKRGAHFCSVV